MTHRNDTMPEPAAAEQGQPDREERVKSTELKHLIDYMFTAAASDQVDATGCRSVYSGPTAHESRQTLPWDMDPTTVCQYPQQKPPRIEPLWAQSCMQFNTVRRQSRLSSLDALARRTLVSSGTQYCRKGASDGQQGSRGDGLSLPRKNSWKHTTGITRVFPAVLGRNGAPGTISGVTAFPDRARPP